MAEIAEGFTVNANLTLDIYSSLDYIGDIIHGRGIRSLEDKEFTAVLTLDTFNQNSTIGDLLRANVGNQGFTIKSTLSLETTDNNSYFADIVHSRCIIKDDAGDTLSSITLGSINANEYIGDIIRANSGNEGFTLKSSLSLNTPDISNYFADIAHARCIITDDNNDFIGSITLDVELAKEILGDVIRSNSGQEGFTVKGSSRLNNYDESGLIAEIYRSISGRRKASIGVILYKGKRYLVYTKDTVHYFVTKMSDE